VKTYSPDGAKTTAVVRPCFKLIKFKYNYSKNLYRVRLLDGRASQAKKLTLKYNIKHTVYEGK